MIETTLKPYPEYREVDLPWISESPSHWELGRVKGILREIDDKTETGTEELLSLRQHRGLVPHKEVSNKPIGPSALVGYKRVQPGDLVVNRMRASTGLIATAGEPGLVSPDYAVFRPRREVDLDYLVYLFTTPQLQRLFRAESKGLGTGSSGFLRLYSDDFGALNNILPPIDEQHQIVRYLDVQRRRVNRLIRAKQQLIALLNEQKQAIIQRAVTRGLDPDVPLKPSGVDWLGDVPVHWEVRRLRYLCGVKTGGRDTVDRVESGEYPFFVRSQNVERIDTYSFDGEAVLTAGDGAGVAKVFHYANGKFDYHQRVYKFSGFKEVSGRFFFYYVSSNLKYEVLRLSAKSTVDSLRLPMLQNFTVAFPPPVEQDQIVAHIEADTGQIDEAINRARAEIDLIREYRTRLIADVVTGKLDVRGVAVPEAVGDGADAELDVAEDDQPILNDEALAHADD